MESELGELGAILLALEDDVRPAVSVSLMEFEIIPIRKIEPLRNR